ncbi:MAG: hypothetical protein EZS28_024958, partial [Streblomastix strix]
SIMDVTKQIKLKQLQKDQPDAEFDEDFEKSQYGSSADSDVPPIITRAARISGTQEIVPIPPLWSAKIDPQREKDILIELLDNEMKVSDYSQQKQKSASQLSNYSQKPVNKQGRTNSTTITSFTQIGSLITNQPGFFSKVPQYIQQPDSSFHQIITKKGSIIPSIPGNIHATEQPTSFIRVTPSKHHSLFVIPIPFRPPAPEIQVVNSCNYTAATLTGWIIRSNIKILPQPIAENDFRLDIADGAITLNDEADAIRLQKFIHKPTQPSGKKWLEDEDEIGIIYGATLRAYSVLLGLLYAFIPGKKLLFIRPKADLEANSLNHERRIVVFEEKYRFEEIIRIVDGWNAISVHTELGEIPIGKDDEEYGGDTQQQNGWTNKSIYSQEGCIYDLLSASFNPTTYITSKLFKQEDFINPTPTGCTPIDCLSQDQMYKSKCINGKDPQGCMYSKNDYYLSGISPSAFERLDTGYPRVEDACPFQYICVDQPDSNCVCDTNPDPNNRYPLHECQSSKVLLNINTSDRSTPLCTSTDSGPLIISDSCFCTDTDHLNWLSMSKLIPQNYQEYPKQIVSVFLLQILKQMVFVILIAQDMTNQMLIV